MGVKPVKTTTASLAEGERLGIDYSSVAIDGQEGKRLGIDYSGVMPEQSIPAHLKDAVVQLEPEPLKTANDKQQINPLKFQHESLLTESDITARPMSPHSEFIQIREAQRARDAKDIYDPTSLFDVDKVVKAYGGNYGFVFSVQQANERRAMGRYKEADEISNRLTDYVEKTYGLSGSEALDFISVISLDESSVANRQVDENGKVSEVAGLDYRKFQLDNKIEEYKNRPSQFKSAMKSAWNGGVELAGGLAYLANDLNAWRNQTDFMNEAAREGIKETVEDSKFEMSQFESRGAQLLGGAIPSMVPVAVGTTVSLTGNPVLGGRIASFSFGAMGASTVGNSLKDYDEYHATNKLDINPWERWAVGLGAGTAEVLFERLGVGGGLISRGAAIGRNTMRVGAKLSIKESVDLGKDVIASYARKNPAAYQKFIKSAVVDYNKEGFTEALTTLSQEMMDNYYKENKDKINGGDIIDSMWDSYWVGGAMGAGMSPLSFASENQFHKQRRLENEGVVLSTLNDEAVEVIQERGKDKVQIMYPNGRTEDVLKEELGEIYQVPVERFDAILKSKGLEEQVVEDWRVDAHAKKATEINQRVDQLYTPLTQDTPEGKVLFPAKYGEENVFITKHNEDGSLSIKQMGSSKITVVPASQVVQLDPIALEDVRNQEVGEAGYVPDNVNGLPYVGEPVEMSGVGKGVVVGYDVTTGDATVEFEIYDDPESKEPRLQSEVMPRSILDTIRIQEKEMGSEPVNFGTGGDVEVNINEDLPSDEVKEIEVGEDQYRIVNGMIEGNTLKEANEISKKITEAYPNLITEVVDMTDPSDDFAKAAYSVRVVPKSTSQTTQDTSASKNDKRNNVAKSNSQSNTKQDEQDGKKNEKDAALDSGGGRQSSMGESPDTGGASVSKKGSKPDFNGVDTEATVINETAGEGTESPKGSGESKTQDGKESKSSRGRAEKKPRGKTASKGSGSGQGGEGVLVPEPNGKGKGEVEGRVPVQGEGDGGKGEVPRTEGKGDAEGRVLVRGEVKSKGGDNDTGRISEKDSGVAGGMEGSRNDNSGIDETSQIDQLFNEAKAIVDKAQGTVLEGATPESIVSSAITPLHEGRRQEVEKSATAITKGWKNAPKVVVVESHLDAQVWMDAITSLTGQPREVLSKVDAAFQIADRTFIIASHGKFSENMDREVLNTILHEAVGHYGLRGLTNSLTGDVKPLRDLLDTLFPEMDAKKLQKITDMYTEKTPDAGKSFKDLGEERRYIVLEEYLAHEAEVVNSTLFEKFAAWFNAMLEKSNLKKITDPNVRDTLANAKKFIEVGENNFVRNPNKPNTEVRQQKSQVNSPAFKEWFGDSKVVDENGKPLVVYHGTASDFNDFSEKLLGKNFDQSTLGFYFTSGARPDMSKGIPYGSTASEYAFNAQKSGYSELDGANVMPVYLSIKNPLIIKGDGWYSPNTAVDKQRSEISRELDSGKYDGVIAENINTDEYGTEKIFIALNPTQIKSATGNSGQFDGSNPDIRFQKGNSDPYALSISGRISNDLLKGKTIDIERVFGADESVMIPAKDAHNLILKKEKLLEKLKNCLNAN